MTGVIDYDRLAGAVADKMAKAPPREKVLWGPDECAAYLRMTKNHFLGNVSKGDQFPAPVTLPSETGKKPRKLWYAVDVIDWASRQRK